MGERAYEFEGGVAVERHGGVGLRGWDRCWIVVGVVDWRSSQLSGVVIELARTCGGARRNDNWGMLWRSTNHSHFPSASALCETPRAQHLQYLIYTLTMVE